MVSLLLVVSFLRCEVSVVSTAASSRLSQRHLLKAAVPSRHHHFLLFVFVLQSCRQEIPLYLLNSPIVFVPQPLTFDVLVFFRVLLFSSSYTASSPIPPSADHHTCVDAKILFREALVFCQLRQIFRNISKSVPILPFLHSLCTHIYVVQNDHVDSCGMA